MRFEANSHADTGRHTVAHTWKPVAMLMLALVALIYLMESDVLQAAIQSVLGSPLR